LDKKHGPFNQSLLPAKSEILGSLVGMSGEFKFVCKYLNCQCLLCIWTSPTLLATKVLGALDWWMGNLSSKENFMNLSKMK
jgi:hypothetical protein